MQNGENERMSHASYYFKMHNEGVLKDDPRCNGFDVFHGERSCEFL